MAPTRTLVIGLDAAEPALLRRWCASGHLPTLRRLLDGAAWGEVDSGSSQFPDTAMLSAYTGLRPANLGRYFFIEPRGDQPRLALNRRPPAGEPFWVTAGRHGRRCVVVDTPKIALHPPHDGVHVVGWGAHGFNPSLATHPAPLAGELLARHGRYPLENCDNHGRALPSYRRLRRALLAGVAARRRLLLDLAGGREWDLFFAVFAEPHCAGHNLWHLDDPTHPLHRGDAGLATSLRDVYAAVDAAVGDLIAAAGAGARVVLFSSQGMRPQYHGRDLVPALLRRWGMHEARDRPPAAREVSGPARQPLLKTLREAVPLPLQYAVKRRLPQPLAERLLCRFMGAMTLEVGARAFQVPNNEMNPSLRVNVIGRDPRGIVAPGAEYEALCRFLATRLRELRNPASGRPALAEVSVTDEAHRGAYRDALPDVVGYWSAEAPIDALHSPGYGTVVGSHRDSRTGGHGPRGLIAVSGAAGRFTGGHIADLAPTVLDVLGVPAPPDLDGHSLLRVR